MSPISLFFALVNLLTFTLLLACQDVEFTEHRRAKAITEDDFLTLTFQAGQLVSSELSYEPEASYVSQVLEMLEPNRISEEWVQITRPIDRDRFFQGHNGFAEREVLSLREAGRLDLLIVMDDSSSMHPYQELMKHRFQDLLSRISNTDWQIAVVTTTSSCLRQSSDGIKLLRRDDYRRSPETAQRRFEELISPGEYGSTVERGILMATEGLIGDCGDPAARWTRENSEKAVLIISDEKNCGSASNEGCRGQEYEKAEFFLNKAPSGSRVYGLFHFKDNPFECPQSGGYEDMYPVEYQRLVEMTGGFSDEICQRDYSKVVTQLSAHVSEFVRKVFSLKYEPVANSLQLELAGELIKEGYRLEGKALYLDFPVDDPDAFITVNYRHNPAPMFQEIAMERPADPETIQVAVNQKRLRSQDFQYDQNMQKLKFHEMPEERSIIDVEYRQLGHLRQSFATNVPQDLYEMAVFVNDEERFDYIWDASWQQLRFDEPPRDGARIRLEYIRERDLTLEYPIEGLEEEDIADYWLEDLETGDLLDIELRIANQKIIFAVIDFKPGRRLKIVYQVKIPDRTQPISWLMPEHLIEESVEINSAGQDESCGRSISFSGRQLEFICESADREGFHIRYQYVENYQTTFEVDPDNRMPGRWQVFVNDQEIFEYERKDGWLILNTEQIAPGDQVRVRGLLKLRD